MSKYTDIIFDLDGTIIESQKGIINSLIYSIKKMGYNVYNEKDYIKYIGLSLEDIYKDIFNTEDNGIIKKAIEFYREDFSEKGIYENYLYNGIEEVIRYLYNSNISIYLASIKPAIYSTKILEFHNLKKYFKFIIGSQLNGEHSDKSYMINTILKKFNIDNKCALMIGDRIGDIRAAKDNSIDSVGVCYGYGKKEELMEVSPTYLIDSIIVLKDIVK